MTDNEALDEFLNYISSIKSYSDNTVLSYKNDRGQFLQLVEKSYHDAEQEYKSICISILEKRKLVMRKGD